MAKAVVMQIVAGLLALHAKGMPNKFSRYQQRLVKRGVHPMKAAYKTGSKLIDVLYACLRKGELYDERSQPPGVLVEASQPEVAESRPPLVPPEPLSRSAFN